MKTFESLFAELSEKAANQTPGSLTVDELGKGTHFIGKKIIEEAGETWIAAEYEGAERTAEEMIPEILKKVYTKIFCEKGYR